MKQYGRLRCLPLGMIHPEGFLRDQFERSKHGMGGHLDELEPGMIADPYVHRTYVKQWGDGDQEGWGAEISGNYWTGLIQLAFSMQDKELIKKATDWVDAMLKNRKPDGYLGTYLGEDSDIYDDYNGWGTACMLRGLLAFYEATKRQDVLDAVHDCLLWFVRTWSSDKKTTYAAPFLIDPLVTCCEITGDMRLADFAEEYEDFICRHDIFENSYKDFLSPNLNYTSNHTAGLGNQLRLPAMVFNVTGKEEYLKASENEIDKVYKKCTHLTGGPVSVTEYLAPVSGIAETEYCSFAFFNGSFSRLASITGKSFYGDYMEQLFYNGAQGARKKDEKCIAYLSSPNQIYATDISSYSQNGLGMQAYAPCYPVSCCPVNSVLLLPEFVRGMFFTDTDGSLYANAYGPCSVQSDAFDITEETSYPFRDTIRFRINKNGDYSLYLKLPNWCTNYQLCVNGKPVSVAADEYGYMHAGKSWKQGDTIELRFFPEIEVVEIDDTDANDTHPLAFRRGALVYSYHIPEKWTPYPGHPATPLPEGWNWYSVTPDFEEAPVHDPHEMIGLRRGRMSWNIAVDEHISAADIEYTENEMSGYVWEVPPTSLKLRMYKAPYMNATYEAHTFVPFGKKQTVTEPLDIELVPYGCTNLRLTYFARADLSTLKR